MKLNIAYWVKGKNKPFAIIENVKTCPPYKIRDNLNIVHKGEIKFFEIVGINHNLQIQLGISISTLNIELE